jgi:transcription elongation factor
MCASEHRRAISASGVASAGDRCLANAATRDAFKSRSIDYAKMKEPDAEVMEQPAWERSFGLCACTRIRDIRVGNSVTRRIADYQGRLLAGSLFCDNRAKCIELFGWF